METTVGLSCWGIEKTMEVIVGSRVVGKEAMQKNMETTTLLELQSVSEGLFFCTQGSDMVNCLKVKIPEFLRNYRTTCNFARHNGVSQRL